MDIVHVKNLHFEPYSASKKNLLYFILIDIKQNNKFGTGIDKDLILSCLKNKSYAN